MRPARSAVPQRGASLAAALLLAAAVVVPGCGLPEKARALLVRPTPTPVPTATPRPVPPLVMEFVGIREERARGEGTTPLCEVDVRLVGADPSEIEAARVVVRTAVDDLGTDLVTAAPPAPGPLPEGVSGGPLVLPVPLKLAPRAARTITEVSGEIELYVAEAESPARPAPGSGQRSSGPVAPRRYRFALKDVPLP